MGNEIIIESDNEGYKKCPWYANKDCKHPFYPYKFCVTMYGGGCVIKGDNYCDTHHQIFWTEEGCPKCDMKRDYRKKK